MISNKKTGVWMDYSNAHVISFANIPQMPQTITSGFTAQKMEEALQLSKSAMLCLQQQEKDAYHKHIAATIIESDEVFLFGPTDAKQELFASLRSNYNFDGVTIEFYNSYNITGSQRFAQAENYFSGQGTEPF